MLPAKEGGQIRLLTMAVSVPLFLADDKFRHSLSFDFLLARQGSQRGSRPIGVQIFVQAIEEKVEKLFGVLLPINPPLTIQPSAKRTQRRWPNCFDVSLPYTSNKIGKQFGEHAFAALPVVSLHLCLEPIIKEEQGKRRCCGQCLDGRIHVAGDPKVHKTCSRQTKIGWEMPRRHICWQVDRLL